VLVERERPLEADAHIVLRSALAHIRLFPFLGVHIVACVVSRVRSVDAYHFEQLYAALVLDASTRVAAAARSGLIDVHFAFVVDHAQMGRTSTRAHVRCCKEADLASLGWL
jgi:hypothetical protein